RKAVWEWPLLTVRPRTVGPFDFRIHGRTQEVEECGRGWPLFDFRVHGRTHKYSPKKRPHEAAVSGTMTKQDQCFIASLAFAAASLAAPAASFAASAALLAASEALSAALFILSAAEVPASAGAAAVEAGAAAVEAGAAAGAAAVAAGAACSAAFCAWSADCCAWSADCWAFCAESCAPLLQAASSATSAEASRVRVNFMVDLLCRGMPNGRLLIALSRVLRHNFRSVASDSVESRFNALSAKEYRNAVVTAPRFRLGIPPRSPWPRHRRCTGWR